MWLEAVLSKDDVEQLLNEFAPLKLRLGDNGELSLEPPYDVSLSEEAGVRVGCRASVHWAVLGLSVPVSIHSLFVRIRPTLEACGVGDALAFRLALEHLDVAAVPNFIDAKVMSLINDEIKKHHLALTWKFRELLDRVFPLPSTFESASAIALQVQDATLTLREDKLGLGLSLRAKVEKRCAPPSTHK